MDEIEVRNDGLNSEVSHRIPSCVEQCVDDPIREMESLLVDQYGRYTSVVIYKFSLLFSYNMALALFIVLFVFPVLNSCLCSLCELLFLSLGKYDLHWTY